MKTVEYIDNELKEITWNIPREVPDGLNEIKGIDGEGNNYIGFVYFSLNKPVLYQDRVHTIKKDIK